VTKYATNGDVNVEKLIDSKIIIDIEVIEMLSGANQYFEVVFSTKEEEKYKIIFDFVWDMRYSIENGYIDRFSKFIRNQGKDSCVFLIENSEYIKYFERQASGTRPMDGVKNYILFDKVDTVIEILTIKEPKLVKISG
jgi:hypothetical protein